MSLTSHESASQAPSSTRPARSYRLNASAYDQVASGLLSALLFVGTGVAVVLLLFFSSQMFVRQAAVPVTMAEVGDGEGSPRGSGSDLNEPAGDDVPDELQQESPLESVETVTAAVSSRAAQFDDVTLDSQFTPGKGGGRGDGRGTGRGRGGEEQTPRPQRWVIHFDGGNIKTYAKQLDFFGIELAAIGGSDNLVHYAFNLAKPKPDHRTGPPDNEQRLYMTWRAGPLQAADRELLTKAGVDVTGRVIMQFYPKATEDTLAKLERTYAAGKDINDIRRTTFDVRASGEKFEFVVSRQQLF